MKGYPIRLFKEIQIQKESIESEVKYWINKQTKIKILF
jgi:hypothetical protein